MYASMPSQTMNGDNAGNLTSAVQIGKASGEGLTQLLGDNWDDGQLWRRERTASLSSTTWHGISHHRQICLDSERYTERFCVFMAF